MQMTTVLLDLDGVVRHFDPAHVADVERRHGLEGGTLTAAAFESALLDHVITGRIGRSEWVAEVGRRVANNAAAEEWMADRGEVDSTMMLEVDRLRAGGYVVAVLTNGTDTIADEMHALGLDTRFDAIFNSADLGVAKPDRRAFELVAADLQVHPSQVFFTDDTESKLVGAIEIGMTVRHFVGVGQFRRHLVDVGITTD